jgi:CubicO group peptidase (beta-lactamase class C family)
MRRLFATFALALLGCSARPHAGASPPRAPSPTPVAPAEPREPSAGQVPDPPPPFPIPDWITTEPATVGLDAAKLDQAAAVAAADGSYCLLVIRHGLVAYERYFAGTDATTPHKSWSLAKSYSSTLVGIAIDRGDLHGLDDRVSDYVPEWSGTDRSAVTVRNLVSMTSGLQWSAYQDYVAMAMLAPDDSQFALGLPLGDPPGSRWVYHNGAVQILEPLFRHATGMSIEDYAREFLWSRIGMNASWAHDSVGHATPYANVLATCRDHARLGYLYLRGGKWGDTRVLSSSWVASALTPSQSQNRAYGFLFWLNGEAPALDAMMQPWPDRMVPFAPKDLFAARGFGNQFVDVIPSLDLMVVRFGADPLAGADLIALASDARFTKHDEILRPVLDAVVGN